MTRNHPTARPSAAPGLLELEDRAVPAVVAISDFYRVSPGEVLRIPASRGVLANDFSDTNFGAVLTASLVGTPTIIDRNVNTIAQALPPNLLTLNPDGSFTFLAPSNPSSTFFRFGFTYQASNALDPTETPATALVRIYITGPREQLVAVGSGPGVPNQVQLFDATSGSLVQTIQPYEASFTGGVRVATADLNLDGVDDLITAPGTGGGSRVEVFDGKTGRTIYDNFQFESSFNGGAYIAVGDVNGDSFQDIIIGAGAGGGPRVQVINGQSFLAAFPTESPFAPTFGTYDPTTGEVNNANILMSFFAYESSFTGGVRVAAGDVNDVGRDFVVTAPGDGGGPVVKTFDYNQVVGPVTTLFGGTQIAQPLNQTTLNFNGSASPSLSFLAGDANSRNGVNIATGVFTANGMADIVTGTTTGLSFVRVYDGRNGGLLREFPVAADNSPTPLNGVGGNLAGVNPSGQLLAPTQVPNALTLVGPGATGNASNGGTNSGQASGGVSVGTADVNGDGISDILLGGGPGNTTRVLVLNGTDDTVLRSFLAFDGVLRNGVNVGSSYQFRNNNGQP